MWKQTTFSKSGDETTERVINNRYFADLLIRAARNGGEIIPGGSERNDDLYTEVTIVNEKSIRQFKYLHGWAERPTVIEGVEYHE